MSKLPRPKALKKPKPLPTVHTRCPIKGDAKAKGSGHVTAHRYNPETGHLDVTFHGGRSYRYAGVSKETAAGIGDADSVGRYLHSHVIGKHSHEKL